MAYSPQIKSRILGTVKTNDEMSGSQNEAIWRGGQSPSHHDPVKLDTFHPKIPTYSQKSTTVRFKPWVKTDAPSPHTYKPDDKAMSNRTNSPRIKIFKDFSPRRNYITAITKSKEFVPSSATYNPEKGLSVTTKGLAKGYK